MEQGNKKHTALVKPYRFWMPQVGEFVWANGKFGYFNGCRQTKDGWAEITVGVITGLDGKQFTSRMMFINPAI